MNKIFKMRCRILLEILFELAWMGQGYLIARCFHRQEPFEPDGCLVVVLGSGFWITIGLTVWGIALLLSSLVLGGLEPPLFFL